jgi:hypothetical protein|tara:strand:+ start:1152 stop:1454 length:303 start_codon:yes stop_codon:yes gene_type:complete
MYQRIRFSKESSIQKAGMSSYNADLPSSFVTAALILDSDKLDKMSVSEISQLFPYSESMKMMFLEISAKFDSFDDAFNADFAAKKSIRVNIDYSNNKEMI